MTIRGYSRSLHLQNIELVRSFWTRNPRTDYNTGSIENDLTMQQLYSEACSYDHDPQPIRVKTLRVPDHMMFKRPESTADLS